MWHVFLSHYSLKKKSNFICWVNILYQNPAVMNRFAARSLSAGSIWVLDWLSKWRCLLQVDFLPSCFRSIYICNLGVTAYIMFISGSGKVVSCLSPKLKSFPLTNKYINKNWTVYSVQTLVFLELIFCVREKSTVQSDPTE